MQKLKHVIISHYSYLHILQQPRYFSADFQNHMKELLYSSLLVSSDSNRSDWIPLNLQRFQVVWITFLISLTIYSDLQLSNCSAEQIPLCASYIATNISFFKIILRWSAKYEKGNHFLNISLIDLFPFLSFNVYTFLVKMVMNLLSVHL